VFESGYRLDTEWEIPAGGQTQWYQSRAVPEISEDGVVEHVLVMTTDITALKRTEAELAHQALHDPLTGLANRALLLDQLARILARRGRPAGTVALLFLDLDRLKDLNDNHGHATGDAVLVEVGHRISRTLRSDDFVGRFAGDEFVVLLPSLAAPDDAWRVADAIHQQVRRPIAVAGGSVHASVSIGLTIARPGDRPEDVLHRADVALYRAKDAGRARTEADVSDAPPDRSAVPPTPRESFTGEAATLAHHE